MRGGEDRDRRWGRASFLGWLLCGGSLLGCSAVLSELAQLQVSDSLESATAEDGLREALRVGTGRAVELLGRPDGYLGNADVRIPVPEKVEKLGKALRAIGAGDVVEEFVTSMNRAAEAAAPVAREVFVDTIREMGFRDAVEILRGKGHEATDYLREHAGPHLGELFRPIVADKLEAVGATRDFDRLLARTERLPFVDKPVLDLNEYVTGRALDGLFLVLAREEERIREDPLARTTALLKKFFGPGAER